MKNGSKFARNLILISFVLLPQTRMIKLDSIQRNANFVPRLFGEFVASTPVRTSKKVRMLDLTLKFMGQH